MGAQGVSPAWLGNAGSFLLPLFSIEAMASLCVGEFAQQRSSHLSVKSPTACLQTGPGVMWTFTGDD